MNKKIIPILFIIASIPLQAYGEGLLTYKPPKSGAPQLRIGGGTRSLRFVEPKALVLAPHHKALTSQAQPVLYWYLKQPSQETIEITLAKDNIDSPLVKKKLSPIVAAGLQNIRLADYGVYLKPDEDYQWTVAIVDNTGQIMKDSISSATLRYQTLTTPFANVEQQAEAGYWYDALQQLIERHSPLVNSLLKQVDIEIPDL